MSQWCLAMPPLMNLPAGTFQIFISSVLQLCPWLRPSCCCNTNKIKMCLAVAIQTPFPVLDLAFSTSLSFHVTLSLKQMKCQWILLLSDPFCSSLDQGIAAGNLFNLGPEAILSQADNQHVFFLKAIVVWVLIRLVRNGNFHTLMAELPWNFRCNYSCALKLIHDIIYI